MVLQIYRGNDNKRIIGAGKKLNMFEPKSNAILPL